MTFFDNIKLLLEKVFFLLVNSFQKISNLNLMFLRVNELKKQSHIFCSLKNNKYIEIY